MTKKQLEAHFEGNLEKVREAHKNDSRYIKYAEEQLNAVKRGGMEELKRFWAEWNRP